ncbi:hypothetical protein HK097_000108 [Rhizophlyctis rosea]|uniref:Uncharacterized protein n=1 Tax=Rhizophlyctis rosea TaxID=64517 RepID=A0AAD5S916_9FUNG|nr:hypothetical protein HK097_000108 [Rhizophlyctis rosea]
MSFERRLLPVGERPSLPESNIVHDFEEHITPPPPFAFIHLLPQLIQQQLQNLKAATTSNMQLKFTAIFIAALALLSAVSADPAPQAQETDPSAPYFSPKQLCTKCAKTPIP